MNSRRPSAPGKRSPEGSSRARKAGQTGRKAAEGAKGGSNARRADTPRRAEASRRLAATRGADASRRTEAARRTDSTRHVDPHSAPGGSQRRPNAQQRTTRRPESARTAQSASRAQAARRTQTSRRAGAPEQAQAAEDSRFSRTFNFSLKGGEKTRQFSLRTLVVALFAIIGVVMVANPLGQYLDQQQEKRALAQEVAEVNGRVEALEQELARWDDPEFVKSQARERLGFVMPGETLYLVSDPDEGTPAEVQAERTKQVNDQRRAATPFYVTMWDSIQIAGNSDDGENPSNVPVIGQ